MLQKEEIVLENEKLFREYQGGDRVSWANQVIEDREFLLGEQFSQAVKEAYNNKGIMAAPVNEVNPSIMLIVAQLTENDPRFAATGREDSDVKVASYVSDLMQYMWDISKGKSHVKRFVKDFVSVGVGGLMNYYDAYADNGKGELKICAVDPLELYIDPNSKEPDSSDASNIILSKVVDKAVFNVSYPDVDLTDAETEKGEQYSTQRARTQGQILFPSQVRQVRDVQYIRLIDRYTKIKSPIYHVLDTKSPFEIIFEKLEEFNSWLGEQAFIISRFGQDDSILVYNDQVQEMMGIYKVYGNVYHYVRDEMGNPQIASGIEIPNSNAVPNSTTQLTLTTKQSLIEQGLLSYDEPKVDRIKRIFSAGGIKIAEDILPISDYPIVTCMLHHERNPFASGDIRLVKPIQEELNILDARLQAYLRNITTIRVLTQKNSGIKRKLDDAGDPLGMEVYEVDMETGGAPVPMQYPPLPSGIMQQRQGLIQQIQRVIGAYSFQDGDTTQAPQTSSGTSMIDEFMRRRSAYKKKLIEDSLDQLAKVVSQYIPKVYNTRKMISIISPNHGQARRVIFNDPQMINGEISLVNDLSSSTYDIRVISGSMLPSNRTAESQMLIKLYEMGVIHNSKWALQKMDFDNIDQIIEEEDAMKQLQSQLAQMQQQMKMLQGQLQTKSREVIQANEKVEVMKTKTELKDLSNQVKGSVELTQQRLNDHTKNIKKEQENGSTQ